MTVEQRCAREVVELHRFFEQWFNGELPETDEAFARFERALGPEFEMIGPGGGVLSRAAVLAMVRDRHGTDPTMRIRIERHRCRLTAGALTAATYEEWQQTGAEARGRISTVIFQEAPATPNGVQWLHVHETWLP